MDSVLSRLWSSLRERPVFKSAETRRRFLIHVVLSVAILAVVTVVTRPYWAFLTDLDAVQALILDYGIWGPLVLIALQAGQVVVAPIPGQVLAVVAGFLYGAWWGTLYNMIGITIGSAIAFWLARRFGRSYVEGIIHEDKLETFDSIGEQYAAFGLFVLFLFPGLPDDVLCFMGGLTQIPLWKLVVIAVLGRAPAFFLVNVVGQFAEGGNFLSAIVLSLALIALSLLAYHQRERIVRLLRRNAD